MSNVIETESIIDAYRQARAQSVPSALATIVSVEGSAYRRPGARMLITGAGEMTGVLSGGCLEQDVRKHAEKVIETGNPTLVVYDTTADTDIVWGLGVGCRGVVKVLIEPTNDGRLDAFMQLLSDCLTTNRRGAVATVIHQQSTKTPIVIRTLLHPDDKIVAGSVDVFIEVIEPPLSLIILGAGDDAIPLVDFGRALGWRTIVVDTRSRATSVQRFETANEVLLCVPERVHDVVELTSNSAVVLMTHNYLHDVELLKSLLDAEVGYLGCLGPRKRTERLLLEINNGNEVAVAGYLEQLHAPAGLDIGAETPLEIALSIVSEIKAVFKQREGGPLKKRNSSIHSNDDCAIRKPSLSVSLVQSSVAC